MQKNVLIHIPHSSLYIPEEYRRSALISLSELDEENLFMCDLKVDELLDDKSQAIIFPYSRLYCDVERFKDDSELMNKYGMGYIYTKTSKGRNMFSPSDEQREIINAIYDQHHRLLDDEVTRILKEYGSCILIDLHSYSSQLVKNLFGYDDVPDICLGVESDYYSQELMQHFIEYFEANGYSVRINFPYQGSIVPNRYYGKKNTQIVSIMIEFNKRVYETDFEGFKRVLQKSLEF